MYVCIIVIIIIIQIAHDMCKVVNESVLYLYTLFIYAAELV